MQERRADEPQIAREYRLEQRIARERREEEERVFGGRKSEGDGHHIDNGINRLVVLAPAQHSELGHHVLDDLLHCRPNDESERGRTRGGKEPQVLRLQIRSGEFFHRDNDRDRDHTRQEGERDEPTRLGVYRILAAPEPQPSKGGEYSSCECCDDGLELRHYFYYTSSE